MGSTYQPHEQRVVDEHGELMVRLHKLRTFIDGNPIFDTLPQQEQLRLQAQEAVMTAYATILTARIAAF